MSDNLPPGVTEGMIPGNTPEDAEWDSLYDWIAELGMEPSEIRHVLTASQPFMRGGEPVRGTHLRPGDGKWCEYLHNGKICNKCGFSAPAQRSVENAPAESPDLVTAVNEVLAGARRSARGSRDTACVDLTDRWFTSIANWWRVPAPVAPEPAETEEGDRCVMVPIQLLRTEWPPTPQLAPGHKRFDAVYESLLAGAPICEPVTVRYDTWTVIDGHHRIAAARLLGIDVVPVRFWTGAAWVPSGGPAPTAADPDHVAMVNDMDVVPEDVRGADVSALIREASEFDHGYLRDGIPSGTLNDHITKAHRLIGLLVAALRSPEDVRRVGGERRSVDLPDHQRLAWERLVGTNPRGTDRRRSPEDVRPEPMAAVGEIAAPTRHEPDPEPADFPDYDDAFLAMVNDMDVVPEDVDSDESVKKDVQTRIRKMDLCGAFFTDGWGQEAMCILPTPCERHASEDVRGADVGDALAEARKALRCLYIAVDESVARDVEAKAEAAFAALRSPEPAAEPRDMGDGQ
jgi:hypothetical protein